VARRSGTGDAGRRASRVPSLPFSAINPHRQPAIPDGGRSQKYMISRVLIPFLLVPTISAMGQEPAASPAVTKEIAEKIKPLSSPDVEYPVLGMKPEELISTLREISALLEEDTAILDLRFLGTNRLEITTGKRTAPLGGHGLNILFERKEGKWVETMRNRWVS